MADSNFGFPGSKRWRSRLSLLKNSWSGGGEDEARPEDDAKAEDETESFSPGELRSAKESYRAEAEQRIDALEDEANFRQLLDSKSQPAWVADEASEAPIQSADILTPFSHEVGSAKSEPQQAQEATPPEPTSSIDDQQSDAVAEQIQQPVTEEDVSVSEPQAAVHRGFVRLTDNPKITEAIEASADDDDVMGSSAPDDEAMAAPAEGTFASSDEDVIAGEPEPLVVMTSPSENESVIVEDGDLDDEEGLRSSIRPLRSIVPNATRLQEPPNSDLPNVQKGLNMVDSSSDSGAQLKSMSRMARLKPKSANSLTGAPPPQMDAQVEDSVLAPESAVLMVAAHAPERNTFRTYLRRHDIPCRAAISPENALAVILEMKPSAVMISGSGLNPEEIITLIDDINDMIEAPILALLTESQIKLLANDLLSAHVLQYPASLRQIRSDLTRILVEEGNAKPRCSLRRALPQK